MAFTGVGIIMIISDLISAFLSFSLSLFVEGERGRLGKVLEKSPESSPAFGSLPRPAQDLCPTVTTNFSILLMCGEGGGGGKGRERGEG